MEWNGKWYGMEKKFGVAYGRCSKWNGMEDLKSKMEDLPY